MQSPVGEAPAVPAERPTRAAPRVFAALALTYGLAFLVVTPPFGNPDEQRHLARAYLISEGRLAVPGRAPGTEARIPRSIVVLHQRMAHSEPLQPPRTFHRGELRSTFDQALAPNDRVEVVSLGSYGPIAYAPQALAILLGRIPEAPPAVLLYLGRLSSLLAYVFAGWLAITWVPLRKWALCLLLLTPMPLSQAASLSADGATNALAVLFVSSVWRILFDRESRISWGEMALPVMTSALLGLTKPAYWPLAALVLLIPGRRFRNGRQRWLLCASVAVAAIIPSLLWLLAARASDPVAPTVDASPEQQLLFVLHHPIVFTGIALRTLSSAWPDYVRTLVGVLGHLNVPLPGAIYVIYPLGLVGAALCDPRDPPELSPLLRLALVAIFLAGLGCVLLMSYLGWNPVGAAVVSGVQGRYFVPSLPLLLLAIPAVGIHLPRHCLAWGTTLLAALSLSLAVNAVWLSFFS